MSIYCILFTWNFSYIITVYFTPHTTTYCLYLLCGTRRAKKDEILCNMNAPFSNRIWKRDFWLTIQDDVVNKSFRWDSSNLLIKIYLWNKAIVIYWTWIQSDNCLVCKLKASIITCLSFQYLSFFLYHTVLSLVN